MADQPVYYAGTDSAFSYSPNGTGGVNYFRGGQPVTREEFGAGSGLDPGTIEYRYAQPTPTADTAPTGGGTGGGGGGTTPTAQQQAALGIYNEQKNNLQGSINTIEDAEGNKLSGGIQDYLNTLRGSQTKIDRQGTQNLLSKEVGTRGVLDYVGRGIRSGGVMLANKNATDSSAAGALAQAYGQIGRSQLSGVGNQFAQAENARANDQTDLETNKANYLGAYGRNKVDIANGIVQQAQALLQQIDQAAVYASLPDRINMEQEKARIRDEALTKLSQFDQQLTGGIAGVTAQDTDSMRAQAHGLSVAGTAPDTAFNFNNNVPVQWQGTGPFAQSIPLFTLPKNKQTA